MATKFVRALDALDDRAVAFAGHSVWLLASLLALASPADATPADLTESQIHLFQQTCAVCHVRPGLGVPTVGDDEAWKDRRAKGFDVLLTNTIYGSGNMPPLGTCSSCSLEDLRHLVAFVAGLDAETIRGAAAE